MPELPEVETNRKILEEKLFNDTIKNVVVYYRPIVSNDQMFESKLKGQTIHGIDRRAKYLIYMLDDYALISHLRMEGKYMLDEKRDPKHTHVEFYLESGRVLGYHDTRKFGRFELIPKNQVDQYFRNKGLAVDPKYMDFKTLKKNIVKRSQTIKEVLLDQSVIGGIGNIYANEILFRCKIHPAKRAFLLSDEEIEEILEVSKDVMRSAVLLGGTTIDTFETLGHRGSFQSHLKVHGKAGEPCPKCETPIEKIMLKGRGTYFCPNCQKSYVIALTGGIATGKTTVKKYLVKKGFKVFDSDLAIKELYENEYFSKNIAKEFNVANADGTLNKRALRNLIFSDKSKRRKLEKILHPYVFDSIDEFVKNNFDHMIFLDIPLLFETGYDIYDYSVMVTTKPSIQIERLMFRDKVTYEKALQSINAQMPLKKKEKLADFVIYNDKSLKELFKQLDEILMKI
ncbi:MAG TPA: DNA-formamidopyrimidine glycosylase [Acholeplasma sp.]|nr:DNA-formamidopyrimidine glycosylase [Acholeplasma sp.]